MSRLLEVIMAVGVACDSSDVGSDTSVCVSGMELP